MIREDCSSDSCAKLDALKSGHLVRFDGMMNAFHQNLEKTAASGCRSGAGDAAVCV
jgi:hypothetical protein